MKQNNNKNDALRFKLQCVAWALWRNQCCWTLDAKSVLHLLRPIKKDIINHAAVLLVTIFNQLNTSLGV